MPNAEPAARRDAIARFYATRHRAVYGAVRGNVGGVDEDTIQEACAIAWLALVRRDDVALDGRGFAWLVIIATRETWRAYRAGIESTDPSADAAAEIELLRDPFAHDHDPLERALDAELHAARRERFAALKPANNASCCSRPPATSTPRSPP